MQTHLFRGRNSTCLNCIFPPTAGTWWPLEISLFSFFLQFLPLLTRSYSIFSSLVVLQGEMGLKPHGGLAGSMQLGGSLPFHFLSTPS